MGIPRPAGRRASDADVRGGRQLSRANLDGSPRLINVPRGHDDTRATMARLRSWEGEVRVSHDRRRSLRGLVGGRRRVAPLGSPGGFLAVLATLVLATIAFGASTGAASPGRLVLTPSGRHQPVNKLKSMSRT